MGRLLKRGTTLKRATRRLWAASLAAVVAITLFCTINDDNGGVNPGAPSVGGDGTITIVDPETGDTTKKLLVPDIVADGGSVKPDETLRMPVTLYADTSDSRIGGTLANKSISVSLNRKWSGDKVSGSVTTDKDGQAVITFSSDSVGMVELTLEYVNNKRVLAKLTVAVVVAQNPERYISMGASPPVLAADGSSKSTITAQVKTNGSNNPIEGDIIKFTTASKNGGCAGYITAQGTTDADGKATAQLTSGRCNGTVIVTAALRSNGDTKNTIEVNFDGITINVVATPKTIKSNNLDTTIVKALLLDAANNPIVGEPVTFRKQNSNVPFVRFDGKTNNRGEAYCVIKGSAEGREWVIVEAAGAIGSDTISYSNNNVAIVRAPDDGDINRRAGSPNKSKFTVTYTDDRGNPIPDANLWVTVAAGMMTPPDTIFAQLLKTESDGTTEFFVNNPRMTDSITVHVRAADQITPRPDYSKKFEITDRGISKIELAGSPAVIGTNNGKAELVATAYDDYGNRVRNAAISFNIVQGPGGNEYMDPPTVISGSDGTARTNFYAGAIPSAFKGVWIVASDYSVLPPYGGYSGVRSDTVKLTIVGPAKNITVSTNKVTMKEGPGDATYTLGLSAIVSDINQNPVADGTKVTFMAEITGYRYHWIYASIDKETGKCKADTLPVIVASEQFDMSRPYNPFPRFNDINRDGIPNSGQIGYCEGDSLKTAQENFYGASNPSYYTMYNREKSGVAYTIIPANAFSPPTHDIDWNRNGVPDPKTAIAITLEGQTKGGVIDNAIVYTHRDAGRIVVRLWAEAQGLVTSSPDEFILPLPEGVAFRPFE
jgi:hypothetical protein